MIRRGEGTKVVAGRRIIERYYWRRVSARRAARDIYLLLTAGGRPDLSPHPAGVGGTYYCDAGKALVGLTEAPENWRRAITFVIPATGRISLKRWNRILRLSR